MESVGDPNVDPPDRRQIWETPSNTSSTARPSIPPSFPQPGRAGVVKEILPVVGKPIKPIGWLVSDNHVS